MFRASANTVLPTSIIGSTPIPNADVATIRSSSSSDQQLTIRLRSVALSTSPVKKSQPFIISRQRAMAQSIQHDPTALILELSAASTTNIHNSIASPGSQLPDAIVSIPLVQNIRQVTPPDGQSNLSKALPRKGALNRMQN